MKDLVGTELRDEDEDEDLFVAVCDVRKGITLKRMSNQSDHSCLNKSQILTRCWEIVRIPFLQANSLYNQMFILMAWNISHEIYQNLEINYSSRKVSIFEGRLVYGEDFDCAIGD